MISVRNLKKSYPTRFGSKIVLDGVDFDLCMGERLGILGRNGAGKSTLIRLVSGAERPTSGTIDRAMSVSWPLAFGGAFQPQLTGIDNIRFITSVYDQDFDRNLAFVEDFAELGPYLGEPVRNYSSGMRARLAFAISMIIEFDCFLIDEIGAVGDARFHDRCNRELFDVRGDRAMIIISHDAGYIREHCNRWAILHDAKLKQFDDFEVAYKTYKELIGVEAGAQPVAVDFVNRALMIASSQHAALSDERFRSLTQQGDWARDEHNWENAGEHYSSALSLYPYQRSYWAQLGHMEKEQGNFMQAEIAYRTAVALGEPLGDVEEHARFAIQQQGHSAALNPVRIPNQGETANQPPSYPDVRLLAWLFRNGSADEVSETLTLMRENSTLDALAAEFAGASDFAPARHDQDNRVPEGYPEMAMCLFAIPPDNDQRGTGRRSPLAEKDVVRQWLENGAFADWPLTRAALMKRYPKGSHPADMPVRDPISN